MWHRFVERDVVFHREAILESLAREGVSTHVCSPGEMTGPGILFFGQVDQPLCDLVRQLSRNGRERVLAVAVSGPILVTRSVWQLLQSGASDVFAWDHSHNPAAEVAARFRRWESVDHEINSPLVQENLVGRSPAWVSVLRQIVEVARFTQAYVLITGESGTGKELVARLIHTLDARADKCDLVVLDCTTIVPELSGSEFFGHERGAFTGAVSAREGAFALAHRGTLFLDEVGDLPLALQAELLRVVQEHTYKRLGSNVWQETNFRLVCASNRDLQHEESEGRFRRDFYYRIASWTCKLPPLRERPDDILPLANHFLSQLCPNPQRPEMDQAVREYLLQRDYPGNVRDLKQVVSRMSYRHVGPGPITVGDIPADQRPAAESPRGEWRDGPFEMAIRRAVAMNVGLREITQATSDIAIQIAVGDENGNLRRAAMKLGVTDRALQLRRASQRERSENDEHTAPP